LGEETPNYGSPTAHIVVNLLLGFILLLFGLLGAYLLNFLFLLFAVPSIYFFYVARGWAKGGLLKDKLRIREDFIRLVGVKDGERILDVGTGSGFLAIGFAKEMRCGEVVGIDVWMPFGGGTSLKNAERNAEIEGVSEIVRFRRADAREIPYPDYYFDRVVACFVIHIIRGWEKAVEEMVRVLKPGGVFAVLEPKKGWAGGWRVNRELKDKLEEFGLENVSFKPFTIFIQGRGRFFLLLELKVRRLINELLQYEHRSF